MARTNGAQEEMRGWTVEVTCRGCSARLTACALADASYPTNFERSEGLIHEIREMERVIAAGDANSSPFYSIDESLRMAQIVDCIRAEIGLQYDFEEVDDATPAALQRCSPKRPDED